MGIPQTAPEVKLSLPILQEVNVFSRLNLRKERINEISCFSSPVMTAWVCNPTKNPVQDGKDEKEFCAIHWICKVYFAARLGIGLKPEDPYNFEKSKEHCKTLTYEQLLKAIDAKLASQVEVPPQEAIVASQAETVAVDQEILEKKAASTPPPAPAPVKTESKSLPPPAKATAPKAAAPTSIHGSNPGTLGYVLLVNMEIGTATPKSTLWAASQAKGFNSEGRFTTLLAKLVTDGIVTVEGENYTRTK
jgi:hypothetical protein